MRNNIDVLIAAAEEGNAEAQNQLGDAYSMVLRWSKTTRKHSIGTFELPNKAIERLNTTLLTLIPMDKEHRRTW